jgi:hypothetical protein
VNAKRLVPLSGVIAVVLIFASFVATGSNPKADAPVDELVAFYSKHSTAQTVSGVLLSLGALFFLIFSATVAGTLRAARSESAGSSALCLGGGVLLVAGLELFAGLGIAVGDLTGHVNRSALQALHVLGQDTVFLFPVTIGTSAFLLGAGAGALKSAALPKWLGWMAILFAIVAAIPSHVLGGVLDHIGILALAGLGVWTLIVAVLLAMRTDSP